MQKTYSNVILLFLIRIFCHLLSSWSSTFLYIVHILVSYTVFQDSDYIPSRLLVSSSVSKNDVLYVMCFLAGFNYVRTLDLQITVSRSIHVAKQIRYKKTNVFFFRYVKSKCSLKFVF